MLSIGRMAFGQGRYYQELAREDYYLQGGEPPGQWWGRGAAALGLHGVVEPAPFAAIQAGFDPSGEPLVQNAGKRRRPGFDLCFSAPKSVSVVWAIGDESTREAVRLAHETAVKAALEYLGQHTATRRGQGGAEKVPADLVAALFEHGTSRALDPQLHTHALIMNVVVARDGRSGALEGHRLYEMKMAVGALYRTELAAQLQQQLGLECEPRRTWFELKGVPQNVLDEFSKRRAAIKAALASTRLETASAAAVATLATRPIKEVVPPRNELFEQWQACSRSLGFTRESVAQLRDRPRQPSRDPAELVREVADELVNKQDHLSLPELIREAARSSTAQSPGAASISQSAADELHRSGRFEPVGERDGWMRYTTRAVTERARVAVDGVLLLSGFRHGVAKPLIERTIRSLGAPRSYIGEAITHELDQYKRAAKRKRTSSLGIGALPEYAKATLDERNQERLRYLAGIQSGCVRCVEAPEAEQRHVLLRATREAYERGGYRVVGVGVSRAEVENLKQRSGFAEAKTMRGMDAWMNPRLKYRARHAAKQLARAAVGRKPRKLKPFTFTRKTVVIVDDAAWLPTRRFQKLVAAATRGKGLLIFTGLERDVKMNRKLPIQYLWERVAPHLKRKRTAYWTAASPGQDRNRKQRDAGQDHEGRRESKTQSRTLPDDGLSKPAREVLSQVTQRGSVFVAETQEKTLDMLMSEWSKKESRGSSRWSVVVCGSEREVDLANRRCQKARLLGNPNRSKCIQTPGGEFAVGDPVYFPEESRALGIKKNAFGTVIAVKPKTGTIVVTFDNDRPPVPVCLRYSPSTRLGYAATPEKAVFKANVDTTYLLLGSEVPVHRLGKLRGTVHTFIDRELACRYSLQPTERREQTPVDHPTRIIEPDHEWSQAPERSRR